MDDLQPIMTVEAASPEYPYMNGKELSEANKAMFDKFYKRCKQQIAFDDKNCGLDLGENMVDKLAWNVAAVLLPVD